MTFRNTLTWYAFDPGRQKIVFVLDASDIGIQMQQEAIRLLREISESMPDFASHTITFLGSRETYEAGQMRTRLADWYRSHSGRLSVISPLFDGLESDTKVVVVAAGQVFDLMEWNGTPQLAVSTFVSLKSSSVTSGLCEELPAVADDILRRIRRPIHSVIIDASPGFPMSWGNPAYHLDQQFRLAAKEKGDFAIEFGIGGGVHEIVATCEYDDGEVASIPLTPTAPTDDAEEWTRLDSEEEAKIIRDSIQNGEFSCPHCGKRHDRSRLTCKLPGQFLETCVLSEIAAHRQHVFALCKIDGSDCVRFRRMPGPAAVLDDEIVAVYVDGQLGLARFNEARQKWQMSDAPFEQFFRVERQDAYAICLR